MPQDPAVRQDLEVATILAERQHPRSESVLVRILQGIRGEDVLELPSMIGS
jgi:hypothetical protein